MLGIDLVEHKDIADKDDRFIRRVLSLDEYAYYQTMKSKKRQIEFIASRFASKEAIFKVYQVLPVSLNFSDVTILNNDETRAPEITCSKMAIDVYLSITHTDNYSMAVAILKSISSFSSSHK